MITVSKAYSAEYYTSGAGSKEGVESYYLDAVTGGEPPGRWLGSGAAVLGLSGEIDAGDMHSIYGEFIDPRTGASIGRRPDRSRSIDERIEARLAAEPDALPERQAEIRREVERSTRRAVIGWDVTFSVAKSVTVAHTAAWRTELAAQRSGDPDRAAVFRSIRERIETAIHTANEAMIEEAESIATVRAGGGSGAPLQWMPAQRLVSASFFQFTSRNVDPQLHVHNVFLNRAFDDDGEARALDGKDLLARRHALGAVAERVLEEQLTATGFTFELRPDGKARELTLVAPEIADLFSSRTRQISARSAELLEAFETRKGREATDHEIWRIKQGANLLTRTAKSAHPAETIEETLDRLDAQLVAEFGTSLEHVADELLDLGPTAPERPWSPDLVLAESVAALAERRSTWRRDDLKLEVARRLPSLGGLDPRSVRELLDRLTDHALDSDDVIQVSGHTDVSAPAFLGLGLEDDPFTRPSARLYATSESLIAELALRRAGQARGRLAVPADAVHTWLDARAPSIGTDQRAAVAHLASTDAALAVLVGPAGAGKSFTAGALAGAWSDLTGGRVVGVAVSRIATLVLRDDGIPDTTTVTGFLTAQDRLAAALATGQHTETDDRWALSGRDIVLVDEASMIPTADLTRIREAVEAAGAKLVLTGDPHQLSAVEAGGVMQLLDRHAETVTLTEIRRFTEPWERTTSLALRDRDPAALADYDRHGRLLGYDSVEDALDAAATAAVADHLAGRSVLVVASSNDQAAAVSAKVRDQLVSLNRVAPDGVLLGRDANTAAVGDVIACRRNDYTLGVTNRAQYEVAATTDDGGLLVRPLPGPGITPTTPPSPGTGTGTELLDAIALPPAYVGADVQLAYASTVHAAQGITVDVAHLVTDGALDAPALYVGLTRGRDRNTAHVATTPTPGDLPQASTSSGGATVLDGEASRPTPMAVLETVLDKDSTDDQAATLVAEADTARLSSLATIGGRYEAAVRVACRHRLEDHLDALVADGTLDPDNRARLATDQASEHLSRLLRAVEQTGRDPYEALRETIDGKRGLDDADSPAQVLSHRITSGRPLPAPQPGTEIPMGLPKESAEYLTQLQTRAHDRAAELGEQIAEEAPAWAVLALGPVPVTETERADWTTRAGAVAAHREATGWDDPHRPIGAVPGLSTTERRAGFAAAWRALGRPTTGLDEASLADGQLLVRYRAWQTEQQWAPRHADQALRAAETEAEIARQAATLAEARADAIADTDPTGARELRDQAAHHRDTAAIKAAAARDLARIADGRSDWAAATTVTRERGERAGAELIRRGIDPTTPPAGTTTAAEWLTADRAARQTDDAHRPITDQDVPAATTADHDWAHRTAEDHAELPNLPPGPRTPTDTDDAPTRSPAHETVPTDATPVQLGVLVAQATLAAAIAADRADHDLTEPPTGHDPYEEATKARTRRDAADLDATTGQGLTHERLDLDDHAEAESTTD